MKRAWERQSKRRESVRGRALLRLAALFLLAALCGVAPGDAWSARQLFVCTNGPVFEGDLMADVLLKCGEPYLKQDEEDEDYGQVEAWFYRCTDAGDTELKLMFRHSRLVWHRFGKGFLVDGPHTSATGCGPESLDSCMNKTVCERAGGFWCGSRCSAFPCR